MENRFKEILKLFLEFHPQEQSQKYLEKFWLSEEDRKSYWEPIRNTVFSESFQHLPDILFSKRFEMIAVKGGTLFTENEYQALQECMKNAGDNFFVVIENSLIGNRTKNDLPYLQFKFPVNTTWKELNNGDENYPDISYDLLWVMDKEYFVFGDSGKWGKYAACDYHDTPLDIIGYKPELSLLFREKFEQSRGEQEEIMEWLPEEYRNLIK